MQVTIRYITCMAILFSQDYFRNSAGVQWEILGKFSLDNSYPAGGYPVDPIQFGLSQVTSFVVNDSQAGYVYDYNASTKKLLVYTAAAGAGVFNGDAAILTGVNTAPVFTGNPAALTASATTPIFTGNPAALTASATAPVFTGNAIAPTGTASVPTFTGNALTAHSHNLQGIEISGTYSTWRVYHGAVTGGPFVIGETVTDGGGNSAVVSAVGAGNLTFSSHAGGSCFVSGAALTGGTSGATATATSGLVGLIIPGTAPYILTGARFNSNQQPIITTPGNTLNPNTTPAACINASLSGIEGSTLDWGPAVNDTYAFTYLTVDTTTTSGGTPSGTVSAPTLTMDPYTPTGTNSVPVITVDPYTPTGNNSAPVITVDPYTPSGINSAPLLTMNPYTPTGTIVAGGAGLVEVSGGTNLSGVTNVEYRVVGL